MTDDFDNLPASIRAYIAEHGETWDDQRISNTLRAVALFGEAAVLAELPAITRELKQLAFDQFVGKQQR